jgi:DNA repair protein RadC
MKAMYEYTFRRHKVAEAVAHIRSPRDCVEPLQALIGDDESESLAVIWMNSKNAIIGMEIVYRGNVSASLVRIAELFRGAIRVNAVGLILAHNHPSGDATPSPDDLHLTAEAIAAGKLLDIDVLDHLVVAKDNWVSLRDRGVAFVPRR